jgi:hypothetical protein
MMSMAGLLCWTASIGVARAQLGALISPGRLSRAHADLEGITKCSSCHERGQRVVAERCLACHKPVADRMARHTGVHAAVKGDCVTCHVEHAGEDGQLRPFDERQFDHARVTGFALNGRHANLAGGCAACHKQRSFLTLTASCASCHTDVHKGTLGQACASCHSTKTSFKALGGNFDHTRAAFQLKGAHQNVACASCHVNGKFKGLSFSSCTSCHTDSHRDAMGTTCTSCHTETSWRTRKLDHTRTGFPLKGLHADVKCESCHKQPATRVALKFDTCGTCHSDPHRGTFPQDCNACHSENGFKNAPFDHTATKFVLTGAHATVACTSCHKPGVGATIPSGRSRRSAERPTLAVDFRGLNTACASCHDDAHKGELGTECQTCHTTDNFHVTRYTHPRFPDFFGGRHAAVACDQCHVPGPPTVPVRRAGSLLNISFKTTPTACASCHQDVHLGQEGTACERCHTVDFAAFKVPVLFHDRTGFKLTGKHDQIACVACHKVETAAYPAGRGTTMRLKGLGQECRSCHTDVHLGQLGGHCETCHQTSTFHLEHYTHRHAGGDFFVGSHAKAACDACHKSTTGSLPSARRATIQFQATRTCVACHEDKHRGSLGTRCETCHRP